MNEYFRLKYVSTYLKNSRDDNDNLLPIISDNLGLNQNHICREVLEKKKNWFHRLSGC